MRRNRLAHRTILLASLLFTSIWAVSRPAAALDEAAVKATFLYRFGAFVEWPEAAFKNPESEAELCIVGADPFGRVLDDQVREQHIAGRPVHVRRLAGTEALASCHILYIGANRVLSVDDALRAVRGAPVLTITDAATDPHARGMIHFVVVDNRVRFHIDQVRAAESGLTISSRLLALALSVRKKAAP